MTIEQVALFTEGGKRSLLLNEKQEGYDYLSKRYLFIPLSFQSVSGKTVHMRFFVKNKEDEKHFIQFVKRDRQDKRKLPYDERLMGEMLGFPPIAIHDFLTVPSNERVGIDYHGMRFSVSPRNIEASIAYLQKNLPVKQSFQEKYQTDIYVFEPSGNVKKFLAKKQR